MGRLTRAEAQRRNRAKVLAAAREEFAERGFREAKIDGIADRAELTRGAVYSNFPGKRALYFSVLADDAEHADGLGQPGRTLGEALGALARAWVTRLPLATDDRLGVDLLPEILADERTRPAFAQLMRLNAILLSLAMERLEQTPHRRVRLAETVLTTLHGASQLASAAPGFVEPFNVVGACERLAGLDLGEGWPPPHLLYAPPVQPTDTPWSPPDDAFDAVGAGPVRLDGDGVVAILGVHRLEAVEEAVRAAPGETVTVAVVSGDPAELGPLGRLVIAGLTGCLRAAFPRPAWPGLRVVHDESGALAAAAGVPAVHDGTETAVRVQAGRLVSRADSRGACHAVAAARAPRPA
jgi:AcrR family transcriptional regulator